MVRGERRLEQHTFRQAAHRRQLYQAALPDPGGKYVLQDIFARRLIGHGNVLLEAGTGQIIEIRNGVPVIIRDVDNRSQSDRIFTLPVNK